MVGSWKAWSLVASGGALVVAAAMIPFLPQTSRAYLFEDAFEDPGLVLAALGALAGRQRNWSLGMMGALIVLAVDVIWRWQGGAMLHVGWMIGAVLFAAWAAWPMREAGPSLLVAQVILVLATMAWLVHGTFLAAGNPLPTTRSAGVLVLIAMGLALVLRGLALRQAPTLL